LEDDVTVHAADTKEKLNSATIRRKKNDYTDLISDERIAKTSSILEKLKEVYRAKVMSELNKLESENMLLEEQGHKEENVRKKIRELTVREVVKTDPRTCSKKSWQLPKLKWMPYISRITFLREIFTLATMSE
jgi:hypothetical protein